MILTLAWKELREHQGVWLTMVVMSIVLGLGLSKLVAFGDASMAMNVGTLTMIGLAAAYGVVCGAMMLAGEHEGGTLVFLDVFYGRRGFLWIGKLAIGTVLALTEATAVAGLLAYLQPESPIWLTAFVGQNIHGDGGVGVNADPRIWFIVLPVVTLEAFFWGMLGSSMTQRVLAGAAVAATVFTPILLLAICAPPEAFIVIRLLGVGACLVVSCTAFINQSRDGSTSASPQSRLAWEPDRKDKFLEEWERYERSPEYVYDAPEPVIPVSIPEAKRQQREAWSESESTEREPDERQSGPIDVPDQPKTQWDALWWLTRRQAGVTILCLSLVGFFVGVLVVPLNFQILWPVTSLLLGVVCGVAAFAPEQRDQSYQFLATQHLPLRQFWSFKILFWLGVAVMVAIIMLLPASLISFVRLLAGTFYDLMGPMLFLGVWLFYGFATGQIIVWLCRKNILALLISAMIAIGAVAVWLPPLVCGGMSGWQVWAPPLTMLLATYVLVRAWAGGRIWERKPFAALLGYAGATLVWAALVFGYRAIEVPNVGEPLDVAAYRAKLPSNNENAAGRAIQKAIADSADPHEIWILHLAEAARLPVGVIDMPRADGQTAVASHLPTCRKLADNLLKRAQQGNRRDGFMHLAEILALSRNMRNKASIESYLVGVELEENALTGVDLLLAGGGRREPAFLKTILNELNRHADETPPPLDCLQTECFRTRGVLDNPITWTFADRNRGGVSELWLINGIALSMEAPWEAERKTRIWQLVWSGLLRNIQTPHWELPTGADELQTKKPQTRDILQDWLPDENGRGAAASRERTARILDRSWLADERLFASVARLRGAATRARWNVDATRQTVAVSLYQLEEGKHPPDLQTLVPRYFKSGLPIDPYSGETFRYRVDNGKAIIWSTGPDRDDDGGMRHGGHLPDGHRVWQARGFDLIKEAPR